MENKDISLFETPIDELAKINTFAEVGNTRAIKQLRILKNAISQLRVCAHFRGKNAIFSVFNFDRQATAQIKIFCQKLGQK